MPFSMWLTNRYTCPFCQGRVDHPGASSHYVCRDCRRAMTWEEHRARRRWNDVLRRAAKNPPEKRTKRQKTVLAEALAERGAPDVLQTGE